MEWLKKRLPSKETVTLVLLCVIFFILVFLLIVLILAYLVLSVYSHLLHQNDLKSSINFSRDPCDNFYKFICDGWQQRNPIPETSPDINVFAYVQARVLKRIQAIIKNRDEFASKSIPGLDKNMFILHDACLDTTARKAIGGQNVIEQFGAMRNSSRSVTDWLLKAHPFSLFYSVGVSSDPRNTRQNIISISTKGLFLESERFYIEKEFANQKDAFQKYVRSILSLLADDEERLVIQKLEQNKRDPYERVFPSSEDFLDKWASAVVEVETKIATITAKTPEKYRNPFADIVYTSVQDLQENIAPSINWTLYLSSVLPKDVIAQKYPNGILAAEICVIDVHHIRKLEQLLNSLSDETKKYYMDWSVIVAQVVSMDERYSEAHFKLNQILHGTAKQPPMDCLEPVISAFGPLIERIYALRHFDNESVLLQMNSIFEGLKNTTRNILMNTKGMDMELKKIDKLAINIGFPEKIHNATTLQKQYSDLNLHRNDNYPVIAQKIAVWATQRNYRELIEPGDLDFSGLDTNAFYDLMHNKVGLPAGILEYPLFGPNQPLASNYGAIGWILGHEISHGFDNTGKFFDENGTLNPAGWSNSTEERFKCIVDQYQKVKLNGGHAINAEMTLDENIADNLGLKIAFETFERSVRERRRGNWRLTSLDDFNDEQLFFASFAFSECSNNRPEYQLALLLTDTHSPPEERVNVALSNFPEFSREFQCPIGSPMNPSKKCPAW